MLPVIALVGRPNVGKSTLFNRVTKTRDALVASIPGLTRDRQYGRGVMGDFDYLVIDTGGLSGDEQGIDKPMAEQSRAAISEADLVLFFYDASVEYIFIFIQNIINCYFKIITIIIIYLLNYYSNN